MDSLWEYRNLLWEGTRVTTALALFSLILAVVFGLLGAVAKLSSNRALLITANLYTTLIRGVPDLVIEILSPSTANRDRTYKRTLYERHGVKEYWMVDTDARNITVLLLGENGYELAAIYGEGQTLTSPTLPCFRLNLDDIF